MRNQTISTGKIRFFRSEAVPTNLETLRSIVRSNKTGGRLLCIVAVPLYMSVIQLLHFLEAFQDNIEHLQTIRFDILDCFL